MGVMQGHEWEIFIGMVTALGTINAYFIAGLIKEIKISAAVTQESSKQVAILTEKVQNLSNMQERIIVLEKQMAVLDYITKNRGKTHDQTG